MTQILECGRSIGGGTVVFDIEWEGGLSGDRLGYCVTIISSDNSEQVTLVHQRGAGEEGAGAGEQYVEAAGDRRPVTVDADVSDDHVTARFPQDVVGVAVDWPVWKAALLSDGSPVAEAVIATT